MKRAQKDLDYWGTSEQPYWRPGKNPSVDIVVVHQNSVLLIQRKSDPYKGSWTLPGGFHDTEAKKGEPWLPGLESAEEGALRELREETGACLSKGEVRFVGVFDRFGRDPRDNGRAWSISQAFTAELQERPAVEAGDDAEDARWVSFKEASQMSLAFDHREILQKAGIISK